MIEGRTPRFVSAAEITRNFGMWQDRAGQGPLIVTHHGRPRCVLLSVDDWQGPGALGLADAQMRGRIAHDLLAERIDAIFIAVDADGAIRDANARAALLLGRARDRLAGVPLTELMPVWRDGPAAAQLRRTLLTGEDGHLFVAHGEGRARVDVFAWIDGAGILLRPLAAEDDGDRRAARADALDDALAAHGGIASVEISPRGTIGRADAAFAALSGFAAARLAGVRLTDLLTVATRVAVAEAKERVLGIGGSAAAEADLLVNGGDVRRVRIALASLREGYGAAGALALVTPLADQSASGRKSGTDR